MKFHICCENNFARNGILKINGKKCKTPGIWLGCRLENALDVQIIRACKSYGINVDGIIVSAHSLFTNLHLQRRITNIGVPRFLNVKKSLLIADAGSYSFNKKKTVVPIHKVFDIQKKMKCDVIVPYDYQINHEMDLCMVRGIIHKNFNNYKFYFSNKGKDFLVMPVIHGYDSKTIKHCVKTILTTFNPRIVAVGSLVPLLLPYTRHRALVAIKTVMLVRRLLPKDVYLHVFGTGSPTIAPLFFYLGADSVDSQGWITAAAFGKIYLPGGGQCFITKKGKKFKFKQWSREIDREKYRCNCPICKKFTLEELENRKDLRALHNIWVYSKETERVRREIKKGNYDSYLRQKFLKTSVWKLYNRTINLLKSFQ